MANSKTPPARPPTSIPADSAFDTWLNRGLHQLFDDVANEPIPDELLKLIQDDQNQKK